MARRRATTLAMLFLAAGCASDPQHLKDCGVDPSYRPFGQKFDPFFAWVRNLPDAAGEEVSGRSTTLAEDGGTIVDGLGRDSDETAANFRSARLRVPVEFETRSAWIAGSVVDVGARIEDDTSCFLARAWQALKMLE